MNHTRVHPGTPFSNALSEPDKASRHDPTASTMTNALLACTCPVKAWWGWPAVVAHAARTAPAARARPPQRSASGSEPFGYARRHILKVRCSCMNLFEGPPCACPPSERLVNERAFIADPVEYRDGTVLAVAQGLVVRGNRPERHAQPPKSTGAVDEQRRMHGACVTGALGKPHQLTVMGVALPGLLGQFRQHQRGNRIVDDDSAETVDLHQGRGMIALLLRDRAQREMCTLNTRPDIRCDDSRQRHGDRDAYPQIVEAFAQLFGLLKSFLLK